MQKACIVLLCTTVVSPERHDSVVAARRYDPIPHSAGDGYKIIRAEVPCADSECNKNICTLARRTRTVQKAHVRGLLRPQMQLKVQLKPRSQCATPLRTRPEQTYVSACQVPFRAPLRLWRYNCKTNLLSQTSSSTRHLEAGSL